MKRLSVLLFIFCLSFAPLSMANQSKYVVQGQDYTRYDKPKITSTNESQIEVIYFFWYGSDWAEKIDEELSQWVSSQTYPIKLIRSPVIFNYNNEYQILSARIFFTLERLGLERSLGPLFMKAIHQKRVNPSSMKSILSWFEARGISEEDFLSSLNHDSTIVKTHALRHAMKNYEIVSSPTIVINGTYQIRAHEKNSPELVLGITKFMVENLSEEL